MFVKLTTWMKANIWFVGGFILVMIALSSPILIIIATESNWTAEEIGGLGAVGDFLGGSTVGFLSLASILFVIHTITIQSNELELAREEFKISNHTAKHQQLENTLFKMIELNSNIVRNIHYKKSPSEELVGIKALEEISNSIQNTIEFNFCKQFAYDFMDVENDGGLKGILNPLIKKHKLPQDILDNAYVSIIRKNGDILNQYMKNNQAILKFIIENIALNEIEKDQIQKMSDSKNVIIADRLFYLDLLNAQWSNSEKFLLFIFSLYSDNDNFGEVFFKSKVLNVENDLKRKRPVLKNIELYSDLIPYTEKLTQ